MTFKALPASSSSKEEGREAVERNEKRQHQKFEEEQTRMAGAGQWITCGI